MDALTALIARGRDPVDAAVRAVARGPRRHPRLVDGPGHRLRAVAADPDRRGNGKPAFGQYSPARRATATSRGRCRCSRSRDGAHRGAHVLPRHRARLPAVRPAAAARRVAGRTAAADQSSRTSHSPMNATSSSSSSRGAAQPHLASVLPRGELKPRERVDRDRVGGHAGDVAERDRRAASVEQSQTRSHSPGRSERAIGPSIANAIVCGAFAAIAGKTGGGAETKRRSRRGDPDPQPVVAE